MEIIIIFISFAIFTAVLFYKIGRDSYQKKHEFMVKYTIADLYETFAEEFYPNDPDGKMKIAHRMRARAQYDLLQMEKAGL